MNDRVTPDQPRDDLGRTPSDFVLEYLRVRRQWDLDVVSLAEIANASDAGSPESDRFYQSYDELLAKYLVPELLNQDFSLNYADPPDHDPEQTSIKRVTRRGSTTSVTTVERAPMGIDDVYEYRMKLVEGVWRFEDRRTMDPDGRWLRFLF